MVARLWQHDKAEYERRWILAGYNTCKLADDNGIGRSTAQKWKLIHGLEAPEYVNPKGNSRLRPSTPPPPPELIPIQDEQLRLEGDFGVSNDWHAPMLRYDVLHRMLDDLNQSELGHLLIVGDLTNQDALASHEEKQAAADTGAEAEHLHYAIDQALDAVDQITVCLGNHDRHHALKAKVDFARSIRQLLCDLPQEKLDRIQVTARDSIIVDTERGPWLMCHTRNYSRLPLAYPNKLALRYGMHVWGAHRHHLAQGVSANGYDICEGGGLFDMDRMAYVHRYTNDLPTMVNGYGKLVDGWMDIPILRS
jgi:hypothetical protein